ncbi:unnamed protein product [Leptidea sinapis]|uniref:Uncharacterized protein n=1 Tax=Leptidea sinapis TaxID=189913 RepID=A0A5E4PT53_9NEOP|nr:unnamed protein product [Leptidea sinapis]
MGKKERVGPETRRVPHAVDTPSTVPRPTIGGSIRACYIQELAVLSDRLSELVQHSFLSCRAEREHNLKEQKLVPPAHGRSASAPALDVPTP